MVVHARFNFNVLMFLCISLPLHVFLSACLFVLFDRPARFDRAEYCITTAPCGRVCGGLQPLPAPAVAAVLESLPLCDVRMVLAVSCSRGADEGHECVWPLVVYLGYRDKPRRPAALDPAPSAFTAGGAVSRSTEAVLARRCAATWARVDVLV